MTGPDATTRFSDRAGAYSRHRPGYPSEVFDRLFDGLGDPAALFVADIGAGTGISAALLAQRVAHVDAIEPNANMRDRARGCCERYLACRYRGEHGLAG